MMLLPIVERELRVAARHWRTYWSRTIIGSIALIAVLHMIWVGSFLRGAAMGPVLLKVISYGALLFCLFSGITRTADCLSSEKREDTLGLLFLTHLKAPSIIFGKLTAACLHTILFLVSTLPILSIPVMLGGVTGSDMVRMPVSLLNGLLLSMSVGILTSTLAKGQRQAMMGASISLLFLTVALPVTGLIINERYDLPLLPIVLSMPSPIFAHEMSLTAGFGLSRNLFWIALAVQVTISVSCIVAACLLLPNAWQVKAGDGVGWKHRLRQWTLGTPEARRARRTRLLDRNPIFWLGARDRFGPVIAPLSLAALASIVIWLIIHYDLPVEPACVIVFASLALTDFYMRVRVASIASMLFARERQMGTWEMILSTPLTVREILKGNAMTVRRLLLPTYLAFLLILPFALGISLNVLNVRDNDANGIILVAAMFVFFSVGEFFVLRYVAMWRGMCAHNMLQAGGQALLRVTFVPWLAWMLIAPVIVKNPVLEIFFEHYMPYSFFAVTSIFWTVSTALALRKSRRNLRQFFREPSEAPSLVKTIRAKWFPVRQPRPDETIPLLRPVPPT